MPDFNPKNIRFVAGLGNPGKRYENTYHNVGHLFVDYVENGKWRMANGKLFKSEGFMNHAGASVSRVIKKMGVKPSELLLVHDEGDLPIGTYKFSFGSGSAGHRGVKSVTQSLGTNDFWRLRIGIRPKRDTFFKKLMPRQKTHAFVLKKINRKDKQTLQSTFATIRNEL